MSNPLWEHFPHVLQTQQFSQRYLEDYFLPLCRHFEELITTGKPLPQHASRFLKLVFFEPSTRTEDSFWAAGHLLGCHVRTVPHPHSFSSVVKGESYEDTVAALASMADCLIIRHNFEGAAAKAADVLETRHIGSIIKRTPVVINAGDGRGQHPTQALIDLYTIYQERKQLSTQPLRHITILFAGDLEDGRTTNSLMYLLGKMNQGNHLQLIFSTMEGLGPKPDMLLYLARHNIAYTFEPNFARAIAHADVLYLTRLQLERKGSDKQYAPEQRRSYVFKQEYMGLLKSSAFVMHPLPIDRNPEHAPAEIDEALNPLALSGDSRFAWHRQQERGAIVRAALLHEIFSRSVSQRAL